MISQNELKNILFSFSSSEECLKNLKKLREIKKKNVYLLEDNLHALFFYLESNLEQKFEIALESTLFLLDLLESFKDQLKTYFSAILSKTIKNLGTNQVI